MTSRTLSKEKIVSTAIELINAEDALTFTNLSKKLGTRSQAIYNYYPDVSAIKLAIAIDFYDKLMLQLQTGLIGLAGKQAIKTFTNISTQYALSKFAVARMILSIPVNEKRSGALDKSIDQVHQILRILLQQIVTDSSKEIVIERMLRNLIIGEIMHVGNGRFNNELVPAQDSFDQMLEITLSDLYDDNN